MRNTSLVKKTRIAAVIIFVACSLVFTGDALAGKNGEANESVKMDAEEPHAIVKNCQALAEKNRGKALPKMTMEVRKYLIQARALRKTRKYAQAIEILDKAIELEPRLSSAYYNIALIEGARERYLQAVNNMKCFLALDPRHKKAQNAQDKIWEWEAILSEAKKYEGIVLVPAGEFTMGSKKGDSDEKPPHNVYLDSFHIDKYEVTVAQFKKFAQVAGRLMPDQPLWSTDTHPVVNVDWNDAKSYCEWAGKRLPTEAEWEKAARGGTNTKYSLGDNKENLGEYAWYNRNSGDRAHPVGQKKPNQYGLYDMRGNVWEWVSDWYDKKYYKKSPKRNPKGSPNRSDRVVRGGSWLIYAVHCRWAVRVGRSPDERHSCQGFRCAASVAKD